MTVQNNQEKYSRLQALYGSQKLNKLFNSKIAVIGLGGVGSYCVAALARSGIKNLLICDCDVIEYSNINRQLFANENTIGKKKIDVAENYLKKIEPEIIIDKYVKKISKDSLPKSLINVDYIIDAIDDVPAKISLAKFSQKNSIPIISCMGTAMKKDASKLKFDDIYNTSVCPLCKSFRKNAKAEGINKLEVLYSTEKTIKTLNNELGTTSYLSPIAGLMIAGRVIERI